MGKSEIFTVRLTPRQMRKLREIREETGDLSLSEVVRSMVENATVELVPRPAARIPVWADNIAENDNSFGVRQDIPEAIVA